MTDGSAEGPSGGTGLPRRSQADRRALTHAALLRATARALSRRGFSNLNLAEVAAEAGYTRGALYHLFRNKEALALSVVGWVWDMWQQEVAPAVRVQQEPLGALLALARGHMAFCRDGQARVLMTLRVEFAEGEHPVGRAVWDIAEELTAQVERLIEDGRRCETIPDGPPARVLAAAYLSALEGLAIGIAGHSPDDEALAERLVKGLLLGSA